MSTVQSRKPRRCPSLDPRRGLPAPAPAGSGRHAAGRHHFPAPAPEGRAAARFAGRALRCPLQRRGRVLQDVRGTGGATKGEDVDAPGAWKITRGKRAIVVAVLDDGVDVDHPNLKWRIWKNPDKSAPDRVGRDFFVPNDDPGQFDPRPKLFRFPFDQMPGNDIHDTPCAGVIAAAGKGGGAIGIAPGCRVLPVKIFHADDLAADERVADAMRYAAQHAAILSCSWSGGYSSDLHQALEDIAQGGRGGLGV